MRLRSGANEAASSLTAGNDGSPAAQRLNETVEALEVMVAATHELEQTGQANDEA